MRKSIMKKGMVWISCFAMIMNLAPLVGGKSVMAETTPSLGRSTRTISSVAEFKDFVEDVRNGNDHQGVVVSLTEDIDFQGTLISSLVGNFSGVFDGAGHSIRGIVSSNAPGLFLRNSGEIKNLTLENSTFQYTADNSPLGGITAENYGYIENCATTEDVSISNSSRADVGGIAGHNEGTIVNCRNTAQVTGYLYAGGIAGWCSSYSKIENSCNTGIVTSARVNYRFYAGGIVGYMQGELQNCYNVGVVSNTFYAGYAGCIAGWVKSSSTVMNCTAAEQDGAAERYARCEDGVTDLNNRSRDLEYLQSNEFVNDLNSNIALNDSWKPWKIYSDFPYPVHARQYAITNRQENVVHGTWETDQQIAYENDRITIVPKPELGYQVDSCSVICEDGMEVSCTKISNSYQFIMPDSEVFIDLSFSETDDISEYVSGMELQESAKTLKPGESFGILPQIIGLDQSIQTIQPGDCSYSGYDTNIISVTASGIVTANNMGITTIRVSYLGVFADCNVTVEQAVTLTQPNNSGQVGGSSPKVPVTNTDNKPSLKKQIITVKTTKKTIKAKSLRKKNVSFNMGASAQGKISCKKIKGSKKLSVSKTGKVTVKKGTKRGTYTLQIKITASQAEGYQDSSVTKKIKLTVK